MHGTDSWNDALEIIQKYTNNVWSELLSLSTDLSSK